MPPSIDRSLHWIGTWTLSAHILPLKRRRGLSTIFIFIVLSCSQIQLQSLAKAYTGNGKPSRKRLIPHTEREPRYFAQEALLPGLANLDELQPEFVVPGLPVLYTNDPKRVSDWLGDHVGPNGGTLGFDVESVPEIPHILRKATFRGPALVQLATPNASLVIQLARNNGRHSRACIPILEAVLADEHIIKAGVQVDLDMLELHQKWHTIEARSRLDLGGLLICEDDANRRPGLRRLAESVLGVNLPKSKSLAKSNWSQVPLSPAQIAYSARDAWAGAAIVEELVRLDPITFERVSLVERLRSQRPIAELSVRLNKRREAKSLLSSLLAPYSFQKGPQVSVDELPPWKQKTVKNLRQQVRENKWDAMEVFDFEPLRFINGFNSTL